MLKHFIQLVKENPADFVLSVALLGTISITFYLLLWVVCPC